MPSQTLAVAHFEQTGIGMCPKCGDHLQLFLLVLTLHHEDREDLCKIQQIHRCLHCMITSAAAMKIGIKDVIDTKVANQKRKIRKKVNKRERECAEQIGGHTTPASGSRHIKGDARNSSWVIDDKFTKNKSYSLKEEVFRKITAEARAVGRKGALKVGLCDGKGSEVAVIRWDDFVEMVCEKENSTEDD